MATAVAEATVGSPPVTECGQIRGVSNLLREGQPRAAGIWKLGDRYVP
jgi:hypothetical protein